MFFMATRTPWPSRPVDHLGFFLYTFFSSIRERGWFQGHSNSMLLPPVVVMSMFGVEALVILRSHLLNISVFSFRPYLGQ